MLLRIVGAGAGVACVGAGGAQRCQWNWFKVSCGLGGWRRCGWWCVTSIAGGSGSDNHAATCWLVCWWWLFVYQTAISTRPRRSTASFLRFIGRRADDGDVRVLELHAVTGLVPLGIVCVDCVLTADLLPRVVPTGVPHRAARTDSTPDCYRGARRPHGRQQICAHPPRAQGNRQTFTPQRRHPRARRQHPRRKRNQPPTASAGLTVSG